MRCSILTCRSGLASPSRALNSCLYSFTMQDHASSDAGSAHRSSLDHRTSLDGRQKVSGQRLEGLVETLAEGIPTLDPNAYAPSRMVVPLGGAAAASGWRRYLSYRRKPTFVRQQPVELPPLPEERHVGEGSGDGSSEHGEDEEDQGAKGKSKKKKVRRWWCFCLSSRCLGGGG